MYDWIKGASFALQLKVKAGAVSGSEQIRAVMKKATSVHSVPSDDVAELFEFSTSFVAASDPAPAYWLLSATPENGEALDIGEYVVDARIEIGGGVIQTSHVLINLLPRVTGRP
mgnify:CR=1 FL=1